MPRTKRTTAGPAVASAVNGWLAILIAPPKEETPEPGFFTRREIVAAAKAAGSGQHGKEAVKALVDAKMKSGEAEMKFFRRTIGKSTRLIAHYRLK